MSSHGPSQGRRWGRGRNRSRRNLDVSESEDESTAIGGAGSSVDVSTGLPSIGPDSYLPPSLSEQDSEDYYMSSPPKKTSGLTGNISKMFRRAASRERDSASRAAAAARSSTLSPPRRHHHHRQQQQPHSTSTSPPQQYQRRRQEQQQQQQQQPPNSPGNSASAMIAGTNANSGSRRLSSRHKSNPSPVAAASPAHVRYGFVTNRGAAQSVTSHSTNDSANSRNYNTNKHKNNRIFYSTSHDDGDDDSDDDGYESQTVQSQSVATNSVTKNTITSGTTHSSMFSDSRAANSGGGRGGGEDSYTNASTSQGTGTTETSGGTSGTLRTILRYRGFSTSIQNLFLDEPLVCASIGCFGLILSNRTEHLLQLRNDRRGVRWGRSTSGKSLPSRIVAWALLLTLLLIATTFIIWGFGTGRKSLFAEGFYEGYNYQDDAIQQKQYNHDDDDDDDNAKQAYNYDDNNRDEAAVDDDDDDDDNNNNQQQQDDDDNNYNNGDDQAYNANGDDYNANGGDDDAAAANDDGDDYVAGDDGANGDDNGNDDANYNNDDAKSDDYYNYYAYGDDGRMLEMDTRVAAKRTTNLQPSCPHPINGIFKIRDMKEGLWEPAWDFIKDEWYRDMNPLDRHSMTRPRNLANNRNDVENGGGKSSSTYGTYSGKSSEGGRDLASDVRVGLIITFLIVLGILGRRRRMRTRYYLVRARAQEDHLFYASSGTGVKRVAFQDSREDQYEGACSHTLCGCYPVDPPMEGDEVDDDVKVDDGGVIQRKKRPHNHDCVSRGFSCLMGCCCGWLCRCWFQCMSVCALAQEAREIRLLVPTRYQRVDYITHQPFHEYQKEVNDLRRGWLGKSRKKAGFMPHFNALSRLSRYILGWFIFSSIVIVATLVFNPRASFSWPDAVLLVATFLQSFLVIYFVHWIFHKSDLSLDAVIKFFAAGFLVAVPSAFFFEGILVNVTLIAAYSAYVLGNLVSETFTTWIFSHTTYFWILSELFNAYVVAAVTEELCKYYTFRCVEHPDLVFLTGLAKSSEDERSIAGGMVEYPFGAHQVQATNKRGSYDDDDMSVSSRSSHRSTRSSRSATRRGRNSRSQAVDIDPFNNEEEFYEDEHDVRTHRQKAAALTTGMISVAVGLSCAENFLYVFLLGGSSSSSSDSGGVIEEWIVLLFRSLFPVHALAAAMQSVNMIRKFVESDTDHGHRIGVGRIILPAVIMHGTFDAILLAINVYMEIAWENHRRKNEGNFDPENPPYNPLVVNAVAWLSIIGVMLVGFVWYYRQNRAQRARLILLEEKEKSPLDNEMAYRNPDIPAKKISELELV